MNSKWKTAEAIAAIVMAAAIEVEAGEWPGRLRAQAGTEVVGVSAAEIMTGGYKKELPEIVIVPVEPVNKTAETVAKTAKTVGVITETVAKTAESPVYYDIPLDKEQQDIVREIAAEYGVPFELALAVMQVESGFDVDAVGSGNCYGIMQIHKINHPALERQLGIKNWLNLSDNARAGCYLLGQLLDKYQDETRALMAYNMGEGAAKKAWNAGTRETGYTQKVQSAKQALVKTANENAAG